MAPGRRFYYYWGSRVGFYTPVPWYDTVDFRIQVRKQGEPTVLPRKLSIQLIPYDASEVYISSTETGKVCKVSHGHESTRYFARYLLEMDKHVAPGSTVRFCVDLCCCQLGAPSALVHEMSVVLAVLFGVPPAFCLWWLC